MTQFATFRNFAQNVKEVTPDKLDDALHEVAKALGTSGEKGLVKVRFLSKQGQHHVYFKINPKFCKLQIEEVEEPDLELIALDKTALSILDGSLSPIEAFLQGRLRIRGDAALGKRLLRLLASSPDARVDICKIGV
jgi:putative sterol carrier protein